MPRFPSPEPQRPQDSSALLGSPLLAAIAREDLQALVNVAKTRSWHPEQVLFQRGEPGDGIYAVISGTVRIVLEGTNGSEVIVRILTTGDVFGEISLLDGAPRTATAVASSEVRALHVSISAFDAWLATHPAVARPMLALLAQRLRTTNDQVAEIGLLDVETRIARRLWQRFADAGTPRAGSRLQVNQRELAAEMGITRESVNKHLARFKKQGIVAVENGALVLLDSAALYERTGPAMA